MEAFSDGVIAVIITIMVFGLKVPHEADMAALPLRDLRVIRSHSNLLLERRSIILPEDFQSDLSFPEPARIPFPR